MWPFRRKKKARLVHRLIVGLIIGGAIGSIVGKKMLEKHGAEDEDEKMKDDR